jgi:splicing factor U2AF subunit
MVLPHLYDNPPAAVAFADGLNVPQENLVEAVNHFEDFYEEVFMELAKYGELDEVVVADNIGEHMIGNVYVKFQTEDQALAAMGGLNGRYYAGKVIVAEYSPVTDFREAKCRQYNEGSCDRGGYCNFMHPKHVSRDLKSQLFKQMYDEHPDYREDRKNRRDREPIPPVAAVAAPSSSSGRDKRDERRGDDRKRSRSPRDRKHRDERDRRHHSRSGDRKRRSRSRDHRRGEERDHRRRDDSRTRREDRRRTDRSRSRGRGEEEKRRITEVPASS